MNNIGDLVKLVRKSKGMTQQELADYLGVGKAAVSRYESGTRVPNYKIILKLGELMNVSPYEDTDRLDLIWLATGGNLKQETPEDKLLTVFHALNKEGQQVAVERVEELTEIPKYQKENEAEPDSD